MARRETGMGIPFKVMVEVGDLVPAAAVSAVLFEGMEKFNRISHLVDRINRRWGQSTIYFAPQHHYRHPMEDKIAFGRIPSQSR